MVQTVIVDGPLRRGSSDADSLTEGNQAFSFIGSNAFSNKAGELRASYDASTNQWTIQGDVDGDGQADFQMFAMPTGPEQITAADFIV